MSVEYEWTLSDLVRWVAVIHQRAEAAYRDMRGVADTASAELLLGYLAAREQRLDVGTRKILARVDDDVHIPRPEAWLSARSPTLASVDVESIIQWAAYVESAVERLLQVAATPPGVTVSTSELFALHRRELFDIGIMASRMREGRE
ncbi:hypothetical protein [Spectribacter hydrogenoxidans]|uniref:Uncharacterized protein n=1 Tax=Spectribacter hydrogenoxidans TaxID=3075608 RepID=A0ABU3C3Q4_9GAMM|nr:hypothetical protein [Salinisphaera sp. W335]MDT0636189.1 hypothetical protein [Salinisphaera sp. W335]